MGGSRDTIVAWSSVRIDAKYRVWLRSCVKGSRPVKPWYRVETYERMKITGFTQVAHGSVRLLCLVPEPPTDVIVL